MENDNMRRLKDGTLENVLKVLNPDFIKDLPEEPEKLFEFAQRRIKPEISDNISFNLGTRMLESRLSDEDYLITFFKVINDVFHGKTPTETVPQAQVLVSQTGAGKTNLRKKLLLQCPNTAIINSDLYKKFRPDADIIMKEDPTNFGALTGIDCYDHANNVFNFATSMRYNILMECAPSMKDGLVGVNLEKLYDREYQTKFHIMAVGDLISALAIHFRYESDIEKKQPGAKLTDLRRHNDSYAAVEDVIQKLNPQDVIIYRRGNEEEGRIPIYISDGIPEINVATNLRLLKTERINSNRGYCMSGRLKADYETIESLMEGRNAPEAQRAQLAEVREKYIHYLGEEKILGNDGIGI